LCWPRSAATDRFRLFNFTRRDDHVAYLWVSPPAAANCADDLIEDLRRGCPR